MIVSREVQLVVRLAVGEQDVRRSEVVHRRSAGPPRARAVASCTGAEEVLDEPPVARTTSAIIVGRRVVREPGEDVDRVGHKEKRTQGVNAASTADAFVMPAEEERLQRFADFVVRLHAAKIGRDRPEPVCITLIEARSRPLGAIESLAAHPSTASQPSPLAPVDAGHHRKV